MELSDLAGLAEPAGEKIVLLVLDGLGGLPMEPGGPTELEARNANLVGGDVGGGAMDLGQVVFRPFASWNPYRLPGGRIFLCSASTPPGGGVHGMCGYHAARAALRVARGG